MLESIQAKCDAFIQNRAAAKQVFRLSSPMMHCLCALQITAQGLVLPVERLQDGKKWYKSAFSAFSVMRSTAMPNMVTLTSLQGFPPPADGSEQKLAVQDFLSDLNRAFFELKTAGFRPTDYHPITAWLLATGAPRADWEALCAKARRLYLGMRERHPFFTSAEDACLAMSLAMETDANEEETLVRCENAFGLLRDRFRASNATQTMAHILALDPKNLEARCSATAELFDRLRELRCRFRRGMEVTALAGLTYFYTDMGKAAEDLAITYHRLRAHRGFSMMSIGRNQCAFYAAALLAMEKAQELPETEQARILRLIGLTASVTVTLVAIQAAAAAAAGT